MGTTPISVLANNVQNRIEEVAGSSGAWWSRQFEVFSALIEACNDLMLLIGRPTQEVNIPFTLTPNTVWQTVPKGLFLITDIQGAGAPLYKVNLWDLDYTQSSWGSDWEQDVYSQPFRWAPIGFNMFVVHPAVSVPVTVNVTAITYPTTNPWPYTGNEIVPFEDNFFQALEEYGAFYCRIKELGQEFQEGLKLYDQYLANAKRMTSIQDRRDPLIFSSGYGGAQNANRITKR